MIQDTAYEYGFMIVTCHGMRDGKKFLFGRPVCV